MEMADLTSKSWCSSSGIELMRSRELAAALQEQMEAVSHSLGTSEQ